MHKLACVPTMLFSTVGPMAAAMFTIASSMCHLQAQASTVIYLGVGSLLGVFTACPACLHVYQPACGSLCIVLLMQAKTVLREKVAPERRHEQVDQAVVLASCS